jgi:Tol biopolymer transport system component
MHRIRLRYIYGYIPLLIAFLGFALTTASTAEAGQIETPTKTVAQSAPNPCGALMPGQGTGGFPRLDLSKCNESDTIQPTNRKAWRPIAVGTPVCVNWTLYHTNQTGSWNVFRLGEIPGKSKSDPNISKGKGPNVVDMSPSRSPDGAWVAFATNRDGNWEIYVAAADGSSLQRVTYNVTAANLAPMWSPDGKFIAYTSTRNGFSSIYRFDVATGVETRLTDSSAQDRNPVWSPDSRKIVFESNRDGLWQIYELNIDAGQVTRLSDGQGNDHNPQYSPQGRHIAFRSLRGTGSTSAIYIMNVDGSNVAAISDPSGNAGNQVWSAEGDLIAYDSNLHGEYDIFVYQLETQQTRRVTENNVRDVGPTWRCNGRFIIFSSDITGNANLYQASALPMNNRPIRPEDINQLTFSEATNQYPTNSPPIEESSQRGQRGAP